MFRRYRDVPLEKDASSRFLPLIVALMVYLAMLAVAASMSVSDIIAQWDSDLSGRLTVQVLPPPNRADSIEQARRVNVALDVLKTTPGVIHVEALERREMVSLLEPWLGAGALTEGLPLPHLIDVEVDPDVGVDPAGLESRLALAIPGATVDDHTVWLEDLIAFARTIELVALLVVALVTAAGVCTVMFAIRSGLSIHAHVVEILHQIGARDSYIADQFQHHAMMLGARGGAIGTVLAGLTIGGLAYLSGEMETPMLPQPSLGALQIAILMFVPVAASSIAMLTARATVVRTLARLV